jgi:hypothetical protein
MWTLASGLSSMIFLLASSDLRPQLLRIGRNHPFFHRTHVGPLAGDCVLARLMGGNANVKKIETVAKPRPLHQRDTYDFYLILFHKDVPRAYILNPKPPLNI